MQFMELTGLLNTHGQKTNNESDDVRASMCDADLRERGTDLRGIDLKKPGSTDLKGGDTTLADSIFLGNFTRTIF